MIIFCCQIAYFAYLKLFAFYFEARMDIDSNNNSFNVSDEVEEEDNNVEFNESGEGEEPKKGMYFMSKQEVYTFHAKNAKHCGFAITFKSQNLTSDGKVKYFGIECTRA